MNEHGPVNFVAGGDMGVSATTKKMLAVARSSSPDFMMFGGDLAYANALPTCYGLWDAWLLMFQEPGVDDSLTVPFVLAAGNHESKFR